jgi:uncharacterized protein (TIGR03437 family)
MKKKFIGLAVAASAVMFAQNAPVPATYQPLYSELQGKLDSLQSTVTSQWNGQRGESIYSSELLQANSNSGLLLLAAGNRAKYLQELDALKSLGVQAVVVKMGYPFLYQPFLQYNGDPNDYPTIISYYQQVVADVHAAGLKVIVESASIFPGFFSTGSGLNVTGYYATLQESDYLKGVATVNETIVSQIRPDYLDMGSEPTTEAENTGFTDLATASGWAAAVSAYESMIPSPHAIPLGAGVGTWESTNGPATIAAILPLVDYVDLHVYPINDPPGSPVSYPQNTLNLIDQVTQAGKRVAMSEAWLLKVSDSQYSATGVASSVTNFSLDSYSFWAPLDQEFLTVFYDIANWKDLIYFSAFWSRYYWSYVDYNSASGLQPPALINDSIATASAALSAGQLTSTGSFVKSSLTTVPPLAIVNAASYNVTSVAPNSIMAVFGPTVATGTQAASSSLGNSLAGTTINIKDSNGNTTAAPLFYASPTQVNALLPSGVAAGLATATVTTGSGAVFIGTLNVSPSAPGLFASNGSGSGTASAQVYTIQSNGAAAFSPLPVNLSGGASVYLVLYATGVAGRSSLSNVTATVNGTALPVSYAGSQGGFSGLDQVNILLPSTLPSGTASVYLTVDGLVSNVVQVPIQ